MHCKKFRYIRNGPNPRVHCTSIFAARQHAYASGARYCYIIFTGQFVEKSVTIDEPVFAVYANVKLLPKIQR